MDNKTILYYVVKILIVLAQTSDMPSAMKQIRANRLCDLATEICLWGAKND